MWLVFHVDTHAGSSFERPIHFLELLLKMFTKRSDFVQGVLSLLSKRDEHIIIVDMKKDQDSHKFITAHQLCSI